MSLFVITIIRSLGLTYCHRLAWQPGLYSPIGVTAEGRFINSTDIVSLHVIDVKRYYLPLIDSIDWCISNSSHILMLA